MTLHIYWTQEQINAGREYAKNHKPTLKEKIVELFTPKSNISTSTMCAGVREGAAPVKGGTGMYG